MHGTIFFNAAGRPLNITWLWGDWMRPPSSFWTDFGGGVAPAPAWRKETKGIIATYMALVLRSPWKLKTTWRFRTISDLTAMDEMRNVEHEPQTWFSYVFIIFIHSIQWNPLVHACFHHQFQSKALGWKNFQQKAIWLGSVSMVDHQTEKPTQSVRKHHGSGVQLLWQTWNFHFKPTCW